MPKILPKVSKIILTKNFISISKAAKFLQVSPDTLRNWEREGKLLPSRTHGGARRYTMAELVSLKKEIRPFAARKRGLVSVSIVAKALQVSPDTIRNWDEKGLIESHRSKGGARRFTRDEVRRLQKELGIEAKALPEIPKSSHEVHNFVPAWLRAIFSVALVMLILATGWFLVSYIDPLEKRVDETSKLVAEMVKSIEVLQRGVLGIQTQPTPSPASLPSNINTNSANFSSSGIVITSAQAPLSLNTSNGKIGCETCLTVSSTYISTVTNSDGTLSVGIADRTATVSLSLDHANTWSASQIFNGSVGIGAPVSSQLFQLNASSSNPVVMTSGGNVGIGTTSPINKLEVVGAQAIGSGYAGVYTAPSNGLLVQGNVGIGISAPSYRLDVGGGARFTCGGDAWGNGPATNCSDIAEVYESDGSVDVGEIVATGKQPNIVTKSSVAYQKGIIGVYSTSPGLLVGGQVVLGGNGNLADNKIPVALVGRVPVKVSDENGPVQVGDYLTSSSIPGVAMKATKIGPVLGQALESFDISSNEATSSALENTHHLIDIKFKMRKISAFVNVSFADPSNFFASLRTDNEGNLIVPRLKSSSIVLDPSVASASSQLAVNSDQLTINSDPNYTSPGPNLASNTSSFIDLSGEIASLEDRIKNLESRVEKLAQNTSKKGFDSFEVNGNVGIGVTAQFSEQLGITQIASESANQSASDSATLTIRSSDTPRASESSEFLSPSDSLNLTPPDILLASSSAVLTPISVTESLSSDKLFTDEDYKISGELSVFGKTTLASTAIAGDLTVDGMLSINGNSVNVIGSPTCLEDEQVLPFGNETTCGILYLQNSPLAYEVNFFNGLVTIDKTGNLRAQSVTVAEFRAVGGKISGSGKITAGAKSVDIENPLVKSSSRILITPTSETDLVLAVTEKTEGKKFTVSVAQPTDKDMVFDWFLINESL